MAEPEECDRRAGHRRTLARDRGVHFLLEQPDGCVLQYFAEAESIRGSSCLSRIRCRLINPYRGYHRHSDVTAKAPDRCTKLLKLVPRVRTSCGLPGNPARRCPPQCKQGAPDK